MRPSPPSHGTDRGVGFTLAFGSAACTAIATIPYKLAATEAPLEVVVVLLLVSAASLNTITAIGRTTTTRVRAAGAAPGAPGRAGVSWRITLWASALSGALAAGANVGATEAIARLDPAVAVLLIQLQVGVAATLGWLWLGEPVSRRFVAGGGLALIGVAGLAGGGLRGEVDAAAVGWGLIGALCFGSLHVVIRRYVERIDLVWTNALRLWIAVGFVVVTSGAAASVEDAPLRIVLLAATAAAIGPFAGRLMMMRAVRTLPAATSTLFGLASPVLTVGTAWLFLGTLPSLREALAGAVVLGGLVLALTPSRAPGA